MAAFHAVNSSLTLRDHPFDYQGEAKTPTTPRPSDSDPSQDHPVPREDESTPNTPTRHSFGGVIGQRPLPSSPFSNSVSPQQYGSTQSQHGALTRGSSHRSVQSTDSQDVDMDMDHSEGGEDGSGDESVDGETGRPSKKKKGQRFFYNLRQHAQTVHVNEEIPGDSLAATGTRFQRQIRTERVRPPGHRSRASTIGSQGSHGRGHSRNLSSSSIGSTVSNLSEREEPRRRPPPLIMANDPTARARLTLDTMRSPPGTPPNQYRSYSNQSPGGFGTPTSATFSTGPGSPNNGSSLGSPIATVPRNVGLFGGRTPSRRLSVPSGANPFQSPHGNTYPPPYLSPLASSTASTFSNSGSAWASPTTSNYSFSRRDSAAAIEAEWRRRTWHPSTYSAYPRPATSGLSYYQTPDAPQPSFSPQALTAAGQTQRLPGIESFDNVQHRPSTPQRSGPSPMLIDSPSRPPIFPGPVEHSTSGPDNRRGHASWDMSLHRNLTRLDIANGSPLKDAGIWGQQTISEIQNAALRPAVAIPSQHHTHVAPVTIHQHAQRRPAEPHYQSQPAPVTPKKSKRHGWYNGPFPNTQQAYLQRTSPEDSSSSEGVPTPSTSSLEYHPSIVHSNGYIESNHAGVAAAAAHNNYTTTSGHAAAYPLPPDAGARAAADAATPKDSDMSGLEALVAVATSEEKTTTHTV
ncbi:MAG: hypothetical protein M1830_007179 [Pleopsidium flavum]|nr:MAG: hypothetical protein M1830_007179 [Pleopsidium flavum]